MKKLFDKIKKNNKGFTLVELIVVIAILAIITVVVAPQYLSYVNKARIGTDENTIGEIAHVAEISWVEIKAGITDTTALPTKLEIKMDGKGGFSYSSDGPKRDGATLNRLAEEVNKVVPTTQYKFKSNEYKVANKVVTISLDGNGIASWQKLDGTQMGGLK